MALINQNSIIGITSITSPSASNVLTVHTNDTTERLRVSTSGLSFSGTNASLDTSGNISAVDGTFTGNVSIGGTLTYEDVTNIDAVGIITAQAGIRVTGGDLTLPDAIVHSGDTNTKIRFPAADTITAETGGLERLRITSGGVVLVNTNAARSNFNDSSIETKIQIEAAGDNDSAALSIISNAGTTNSDKRSGLLVLGRTRGTSNGATTVVVQDDQVGMIEFKGMDGTSFTTAASIKAQVDGSCGTDDMPGRLVFATSADGSGVPTERLRITSAGNLGVGNDGSFPIYTGTNDRTLILGTGSEDSAIQIHSSGTGYGGVYFGDSTSGNARYNGYVEFKHGTSDDFLRFGTGSTERLRITSDGHTLFSGLTSNIDTRNTAGISLSSPGGITFKRTSSTGSRNWRLRPDDLSAWGSLEFSVAPTDGSSDIPDAAGDVVLELKSNKDVKINNGNLILTNTKGISFYNYGSGTGVSSNTLDDYEEGTWTVTLAASGGSLAYTTSNTTGYYTKVGDVVNAWWYSSVLNITNNGVGYALVRGLPFNSTSAHQAYGVVGTAHNTAFSPVADGGYVANNNSDILFQPTGSTISSNWVQANTRYLMIHAVYKAA